jgi:tetratricopeptide (TPR) repeat protein
MASLIKKALLDGKKSLGGGKKTVDQQILDARVELEKARSKNQLVIDVEIRNVRYARKNHLSQAQEARSIAKIKNAYYSLGVIDKAKIRLNDIATTQELASAMNNISSALEKINLIYKKGEKPKTGKYYKQSGKLDKAIEKSDKILNNMYHKVENIDDLVSDDVVERIIKGESAEDCLRFEEGIMFPLDEMQEINLDDIMEIHSESDENIQDQDDANMDFSDFS